MSVKEPVATRSQQTIEAELQGNDGMTSKVIAYTQVEAQKVPLTAEEAQALYEELIKADAEPTDNLATLPIPQSLASPLEVKSGMPIITSATKIGGEFESITTVNDLDGAGKCTVGLGGPWVAASSTANWKDVISIKTAGLAKTNVGN